MRTTARVPSRRCSPLAVHHKPLPPNPLSTLWRAGLISVERGLTSRALLARKTRRAFLEPGGDTFGGVVQLSAMRLGQRLAVGEPAWIAPGCPAQRRLGQANRLRRRFGDGPREAPRFGSDVVSANRL